MTEIDFAGQLRQWRTDAGLSIYALAEKSGVDKSFIGRVEAGKAVPSWDTVVKLADALGMTVEFRRKALPKKL